jgi:hypothetical protein
LQTGVSDRLRGDDLHGGGAVVPQLAERLGDELLPQEDQYDQRRDQENGEANDLVGELPDSHVYLANGC